MVTSDEQERWRDGSVQVLPVTRHSSPYDLARKRAVGPISLPGAVA